MALYSDPREEEEKNGMKEERKKFLWERKGWSGEETELFSSVLLMLSPHNKAVSPNKSCFRNWYERGCCQWVPTMLIFLSGEISGSWQDFSFYLRERSWEGRTWVPTKPKGCPFVTRTRFWWHSQIDFFLLPSAWQWMGVFRDTAQKILDKRDWQRKWANIVAGGLCLPPEGAVSPTSPGSRDAGG